MRSEERAQGDAMPLDRFRAERRAIGIIGFAATTLGLARIAATQRGPSGWMGVYLDAFGALVLIACALPAGVGARHRWRARRAFAVWAVVAIAALLPAFYVAVFGWL